MSTHFEQAKLLLSQSKFKKALQIVKKINQKTSLVNFESLELEGICLFNERNYQLALIKMKQCLKYAGTSSQRLSALRNLAIVTDKLQMVDEAINYLKQALEIDSSLNTVSLRSMLVNLAFSVEDYLTVEHYGTLLTSVSEYSIATLLQLAQSAINTSQNDKAIIYLSKVVAEIKLEGRLAVSQQQIVGVCNGFHVIEAFEKETDLLCFLEAKYKHEKWFAEVQERLFLIKNGKKNNTEEAASVGSTNKKRYDNSFQSSTSANNKFDGVSGSSVEVVRALEKLKREMESMGAFFHHKMSIVELQDDIKVCFMDETLIEDILMNVPIKCMPLMKDYKFTLDEYGKLVVSAKKHMLNPYAKHIMLLLVSLYNVCDKINKWKLSFPLFALAGHEQLFDKLIQARSDISNYEGYKAGSFECITDNIVIRSFFGSRVMGFTENSLRKIGAKTKNMYEFGFIPLVDLINHQMGARPFAIDLKENSLKTFTGIGQSGREVFVQYNLDDPVITFLTYGFVDKQTNWIYSVPVRLRTKLGLNITINNYVNSIEIEKVPNHLLGIADYLPASISRTGKDISVSKLIIPSNNEGTVMRAVLSYILTSIDLEGVYTSAKNLEIELENLQMQLVDLNVEYWANLKQMTQFTSQSDNAPPTFVTEQLIELSDFCLSHIRNYYSNTGQLLKSNI
jgi:tetratricopeptide (TPR) repeat protein